MSTKPRSRPSLLAILGGLILASLVCGVLFGRSDRSRRMPEAPAVPTLGKVTLATAIETPALTPTGTPVPMIVVGPSPAIDRIQAIVVEVIDGDTIKVAIGDQIYTVRYIGVDTPETKHPDRGVEWMGPEAFEANRQLVEGKTVALEKDISETDKYDRLLRYVWIRDLMINAELVKLGYAQVSTYPPDVRYQDLFLQLQNEAREAGRGLWAAIPEAATQTPGPTLAATTDPRAGCDPAYPDVCIPPPPPDLDCGDIPYRRFRVLPPDPHRFDRDKDGIGCES